MGIHRYSRSHSNPPYKIAGRVMFDPWKDLSVRPDLFVAARPDNLWTDNTRATRSTHGSAIGYSVSPGDSPSAPTRRYLATGGSNPVCEVINGKYYFKAGTNTYLLFSSGLSITGAMTLWAVGLRSNATSIVFASVVSTGSLFDMAAVANDNAVYLQAVTSTSSAVYSGLNGAVGMYYYSRTANATVPRFSATNQAEANMSGTSTGTFSFTHFMARLGAFVGYCEPGVLIGAMVIMPGVPTPSDNLGMTQYLRQWM